MFQARPTTYRGTKMRSRLEARFAQYLDKGDLDWVYEPRAYAGKGGQYLPDFLIREPRLNIFVELKPDTDDNKIENAERLAKLMEKMEIIWESEPEACLMLVIGNRAYVGDLGEWTLQNYPWERNVPRS